MNLHAIAAPVIAAVNPMIDGFIQFSTGNTKAPNGIRTGTYAAPVPASLQVQELTTDDLRQLEGLNLEGHTVAIYLYGSVDGVSRVNQKGGDLITVPTGSNAGTYLVTKLLERWPDWTKVAATLQLN